MTAGRNDIDMYLAIKVAAVDKETESDLENKAVPPAHAQAELKVHYSKCVVN
jgi:hypothetical protein